MTYNNWSNWGGPQHDVPANRIQGRPVNRANYDIHTGSFPVDQGQGGELPTLKDYNRLVQKYNELAVATEKQTQQLRDAHQALAVRDEALKKQGEELQQRISDVAFLRAITAQQQREDEKAKGKKKGGDEWQERYVRLQAEMENLRRRWEQRAAAESAETRRTILRDMLPLADHLELALEHAQSLEGEAAKNFVGNIEATARAFQEALRRYNVTPIDALGAPFDPTRHEAVGNVPLENAPAGTKTDHVAHVVQRGYLEGDTLLRPARVLVAAERIQP